MINQYLQKFNKKGVFYKLLYNFFFLIITNGINFILPVLIIPLLLQRIGLEKFGLVMTAQAVMSFLVVFTEYGFNITGTQSVSISRGDLRELERIFNNVFTTKLLLLVISFLLLLSLVFVYPKFRVEKMLFLLSFGIVIGKTLLPIWFFLGIEEMKYIAYANFISKLTLAFVIIVFIDSPSKYPFVNLLYSVGDILACLICYSFVKIKIKIVDWISVKNELKSGWYIFITSISININVNSNIVVLSILTNSNIVGMYSVAEKVMLIFKQISGVLLQATFPYASKIAVESETKLKSFLKKEFYSFMILFSLIGFFLFSFSNEICILLNEKGMSETSRYIKYFSIVPLIVSLNIPAFQYLVIYNLKKSFSIVIILGSLLSVGLNYLLIPTLSAFGSVVTVIFTETFVTFGLYTILLFRYKKYRII